MNRYVSEWFYDVMSHQLIAALEDMGVTELIVGRRRHTFLQDESAWSVKIIYVVSVLCPTISGV